MHIIHDTTSTLHNIYHEKNYETKYKTIFLFEEYAALVSPIIKQQDLHHEELGSKYGLQVNAHFHQYCSAPDLGDPEASWDCVQHYHARITTHGQLVEWYPFFLILPILSAIANYFRHVLSQHQPNYSHYFSRCSKDSLIYPSSLAGILHQTVRETSFYYHPKNLLYLVIVMSS
jgi:hypothetical protein